MNYPRRGILTALVSFLCLSGAAAMFAQSPCTGSQIMTAKACAGDVNSAEEKALYDLMNSYRTASKLPPLRLSQSLSIVANRRMLDLKQNLKTLTHSWSDCKYDINDQKTWPCVTDAPRKLNCGYNGQGYETLYRTSKAKVIPNDALAEWKKSQLHNSIILNGGMFKDFPWDEVGVAIDGEYAALWFGLPGNVGANAADAGGAQTGYSRAVSGLPNVFSLKQTAGKEFAVTSDSKITLNLTGPNKEINEILVKLESAKLNPQTRSTVAGLLKNLFPEWTDIDGWLDRSAAAIETNATATRTKIIKKLAVEMRSGGKDSVRLLIGPPIQVF